MAFAQADPQGRILPVDIGQAKPAQLAIANGRGIERFQNCSITDAVQRGQVRGFQQFHDLVLAQHFGQVLGSLGQIDGGSHVDQQQIFPHQKLHERFYGCQACRLGSDRERFAAVPPVEEVRPEPLDQVPGHHGQAGHALRLQIREKLAQAAAVGRDRLSGPVAQPHPFRKSLHPHLASQLVHGIVLRFRKWPTAQEYACTLMG
jgi:hypothetical protein